MVPEDEPAPEWRGEPAERRRQPLHAPIVVEQIARECDEIDLFASGNRADLFKVLSRDRSLQVPVAQVKNLEARKTRWQTGMGECFAAELHAELFIEGEPGQLLERAGNQKQRPVVGLDGVEFPLLIDLLGTIPQPVKSKNTKEPADGPHG